MAKRSLQSKLLRIQQATMLLFVAGAVLFGWLMIAMDETIHTRFETVREIQVVRRAASLLDAVLAGRAAETQGERVRMRTEFQALTQPDGRTSAIIHAAEKALSDPTLPRASLLGVRGEIVKLLNALEDSALEVEAQYAVQRLRVAALWAVILVVPLGLAFFPLRLSAGVIAGIRQLAHKVGVGQETGDASHIVIDRDDEIGDLNRAIDDMFAALCRREQELAVARQLRTEQEKLSDVVSLTGGIAHEVANPLSVILANLDMMDDGSGRLTPEIASIREGLERIQELLRDVTAFASGEEQVDLIDVNGVVNGVFRMVRLDDRVRTAHFTTNLDASIPAVSFSRTALTLSLYSLISLAAAIIRETKGALMVSTLADTDGVTIAIWSSNRGIPCIKDPHVTLPLVGGEVLSTLSSMNRVLKGFGGTLNVLASDSDVREFRLHIPRGGAPEAIAP